MKVLFVYPDLNIRTFYHGIAFLSAVLKQAGHKTALIHITEPLVKEKFTSIVEQENPDLVAFSATSNMFPTTKYYAQLVKDSIDIPIICGGIHPTIAPEEAIKSSAIDMICVGEGEYALKELCNKMESNESILNIANIWIKKNGKIYRNKVRPLIQNLDELPFPDRGIYDSSLLKDTKLKRAVFMASRGCPYDCSYCCNHILKNVSTGKYVRFRSVNNVIREISMVIETNPVEYAIFHDDIFTLSKSWLREFSQNYSAQIGLPFICNSRVNLLDEEIISLLKKAGCREIWMGIESGNDYIREQVLNRKIKREKIIKTFSLCKKHSISVSAYNMVGLPFEDLKKVLDTIRLNAYIKPDSMQVSIFYPFPGTEIYGICRENNFLTNKEVDNVFERTTLNQPTISAKQVMYAHHNFCAVTMLYARVNQLPKQFKGIAEHMLDNLFTSASPILTFMTGVSRIYKTAIYYGQKAKIYYREYGIIYVVRRLVKKILKSNLSANVLSVWVYLYIHNK